MNKAFEIVEKEIAENIIKILKNHQPRMQVLKAIEELSELIRALTRVYCDEDVKREVEEADKSYINLIEEIADVYVMLEQIKLIFGVREDVILSTMQMKTERTLERMDAK